MWGHCVCVGEVGVDALCVWRWECCTCVHVSCPPGTHNTAFDFHCVNFILMVPNELPLRCGYLCFCDHILCCLPVVLCVCVCVCLCVCVCVCVCVCMCLHVHVCCMCVSHSI